MPAPEDPLHNELAAFDTIMQSQPDSAFFALLDFNETHNDLTPFDRHYANLLISEALFKNDYEQTTRPALRQSLSYFDSLANAYPKNDDCCLLSARSHYMNGVGLMEADSVVEACTEYLKALETVENHFGEKEVVGYKAKFMALTYNRLGDLFSDQFMEEQAIFFDKKSLFYCRKAPTSFYGIPKTLNSIGKHYDIINKYDSAIIYYDSALYLLSDTENLIYRDIVSNKILLDYLTNKDADEPIHIMKHIKDNASNESERLTRIFTIGNIYFMDNQYDSAIAYLSEVFSDTTDRVRRIEVASCLGKIYENRGDKEKAETYFHLLGQRTMEEFKDKTNVSQLNSLFLNYINKKQGKTFLHDKRLSRKAWLMALGVVVIMTISLIIIRHKNKKDIASQKDETKRILKEKENFHNKEIDYERTKHESLQNAILGKLKNNREALREQTERANLLAKELETKQKQTEWSGINDFLSEEICHEIMRLIKSENIKRIAVKESYSHLRLDDSQLLRLREAAEKHFNGLQTKLSLLYPKIKQYETDQCLLYLLDLNDSEISVLLGKDYTTINKRTQKLKKEFKIDVGLTVFVKNLIIQHS